MSLLALEWALVLVLGLGITDAQEVIQPLLPKNARSFSILALDLIQLMLDGGAEENYSVVEAVLNPATTFA
jgi:hypothetical protein